VTTSEQQQVLDDWLKQHKALIFKVVRAYSLNAMDQGDLFQEIMIQVWSSIPAFKNKSSVTTWLYRIALNTAIKWTAKAQRHAKAESLDSLENVLQESGVQGDERLAWLYEEIHRLNEIDRSVALLLLDGFSYKEMASILGITETNVGVKINRIKKQLITASKKLNLYGI